MADVDVGKLLVELRGDFSQLKNDVRQMEQTFQGGFNKVQQQATSFGSTLKTTLKTAFVGLGVAALARDFFQTAVAMDRAQLQLRAIIGNTQEADRVFRQIRDFAVELPLTTNDVVQAFVLLQSVGIKGAQEITKALSGVAIAMGRDVFNVAQALVGVETEVLRRLGVTVDRTGKMAIVASGDIRKTVENDTESIRDALLEVWQEKFPNAIEQSAGFFITKLNVLSSSWQELEDAVARTGIIDVLGEATDAATGLLNALRQNTEELKAIQIEGGKAFSPLGVTIRFVIRSLSTGLDAAMLFLKVLGRAIAAAFAAIPLALKGNLLEAKAILDKFGEDATKDFEAFRKRVEKQWAGITFTPALPTFWEEFSKAAEEEDRAAGKLMGAIKDRAGGPLSQQQQKTVDSLTDSLRKQAAQLRVNILETKGLSKEARTLALDAAISGTLKGLKLPADAAKTIAGLRVEILKLGDSLDEEKQKAADFQDEADRLVNVHKEMTDASQAVASMFKEIAAEGLSPLNREISDINNKWDEFLNNFYKAAEAAGTAADAIAEMEETVSRLRGRQIFLAQARAGGGIVPDITDALKVMPQLADEMDVIAGKSRLFGSGFDELVAQISAVQSAIERLLRDGLDPLDPRIQTLAERLKKLNAQQDAREAFHAITDSITTGIEETRNGILQGTQTLSEGLKNLLSNVFLSISEQTFQQTVIRPIKDIINAFFDGLVSEFVKASDDAAKNMARSLGESLGRWLSKVLTPTGSTGGGSILGNIFGAILSPILGGFFSPASTFANYNPKPIGSFAKGGEVPAILHSGEFVMRSEAVDAFGASFLAHMNKSLSLPRMRWGGPVSLSVPHYQGGGPVFGGTGAPVPKVQQFYIDARGAERGVGPEVRRAINESENRAVHRSVIEVTDRRRRSNNMAKVFS